jgi:hypothetical protein
MDAREELYELLDRDELWDKGETVDYFMRSLAADAIIDAGYRKIPDQEEIARAIAQSDGAVWESITPELKAMYRDNAEAVVFLMDGGK